MRTAVVVDQLLDLPCSPAARSQKFGTTVVAMTCSWLRMSSRSTSGKVGCDPQMAPAIAMCNCAVQLRAALRVTVLGEASRHIEGNLVNVLDPAPPQT